jgi:hypothetical protein
VRKAPVATELEEGHCYQNKIVQYVAVVEYSNTYQLKMQTSAGIISAFRQGIDSIE